MCIKMYTFFEKFTVDLLTLVSGFFDFLGVVKPLTSKP